MHGGREFLDDWQGHEQTPARSRRQQDMTGQGEHAEIEGLADLLSLQHWSGRPQGAPSLIDAQKRPGRVTPVLIEHLSLVSQNLTTPSRLFPASRG